MARKPKALMLASVASMIGQFNMDNIRLLLDMGFKVDVAANFKTGSTVSDEEVKDIRKRLAELGVAAHHVPIPRGIASVKEIVVSYLRVKRLCGENNYQMIHCHSPIGGGIARLAARHFRAMGTKVAYTAHGFHFYKGAPARNWLLFYPAEWICSWWTDALVTINKEDCLFARKHLHAKKVFYVPGVGIDMEKFRPVQEGMRQERSSQPVQEGMRQKRSSQPVQEGIRQERSCQPVQEGMGQKRSSQPVQEGIRQKRRSLGISDENIMLLSVGELIARKGHETAIRAVKELRNPNIRYFICGMGELEHSLGRLIRKLGLENQVFLLGYRTDIVQLCQAADLFVFPSRQEGLSVALMEAIACKTPAICSKIRGNTDLVKDKSCLFAASDVGALAECLDRKVGRKTRREFLGSMEDAVSENYRCLGAYSLPCVSGRMGYIYRKLSTLENL